MSGFFLINSKELLTECIKNKSKIAINLLNHRGTVNSKIFFSEKFAIGHTSFSQINNFEYTNKPFYYEKIDCYLTINGEINNYKDLLKKFKINFKEYGSNCQLLFELFNQYGVKKIINELEGHFSGVYIDGKKNLSIIFRDRFGIKPLYYLKNKNYFIAASEINAILPFLDKKVQNQEIVKDFIIDGNIDHTNKTFFENICQLPSGSLMEIDQCNDRINTCKWYKQNYLIGCSKINFEDAQYQLKNLLKELVLQNLNLNIPVSLNLFNNIDSFLLAYIVESICKKQNSFKFNFGVDSYEEFYYMKILDDSRKYFKFDTELFLIHLKDVIRSQSQPFAGMFTVALSPFYENCLNNGNIIHLHGNALDQFFLGNVEYHEISNLKERDEKFKNIFGEHHFYSKKLMQTPSQKNLKDILSEFPNQLDFQRKLSLADLFYLKIPRILRFNDHISMHHSCEIRFPFLDHRLLQFALSLPKSFLIDPKLKQGNFIINDFLSENKKRKFDLLKRNNYIPQSKILLLEFNNLVKNTLITERFFSRNIVDPFKFKDHVKKLEHNKVRNSYYIWRLLSYEWWCQQFID